MLLRNFFALFLLTASTATLADSIDINLRDNSVQLQYLAPIGRDSLGTSELHAGFLYNNDNDRMADVGLLVKESKGSSDSGLTVGVGLKGVVASVRRNDAVALALGGQVHYVIPGSRVGLVGQLYFSPNIVTFRDAERFVEAIARLEYEIIPQASAYVGYRRITFSLVDNRPEAVLDTGFHAGVRLSF